VMSLGLGATGGHVHSATNLFVKTSTTKLILLAPSVVISASLAHPQSELSSAVQRLEIGAL
jgi:hypothetical protein